MLAERRLRLSLGSSRHDALEIEGRRNALRMEDDLGNERKKGWDGDKLRIDTRYQL